MLLVADEPSRLPGLFRAPAERRARRGKTAAAFFLYSLQAAGKSVASINPMPG
jgi:hypothetical protein